MKYKLRYILMTFLLISSVWNRAYLNAQIPLEISVNVFPPYPTKFQIWASDVANYMVTVVNSSDTEFEFYMRASLEGVNANSGTFIRTSESFLPNESLIIRPFSVEVLTPDDIEVLYGNASLNDLDISPNISLSIDGELPEGEYQLCFEALLYDPLREVFLSPKMCSDIFSVSHGNIQLNYPLDEMVWDLVDVPVPFHWSNFTSSLQTRNFSYVLRLFELDPLMVNEESIFEYLQSGAVPFYITEPLDDLSFVYDFDMGLPEFTPGNLYAAQVEVMDEDGMTWFDNQRLSNINTFWFGYNPFWDSGDGGEDLPMDCFERCQLSIPQNQTIFTRLNEVRSFKMGHFLVEDVIQDAFLSGNTLAGTGFITLEFLNHVKLAVQFSGVTLNTEMQALSGQMTGMKQAHTEGLVDQLVDKLQTYTPLDEGLLQQLNMACQDVHTLQKIANREKVGLPFGLGQSMEGQVFTLAIVDFKADVTGAKMDLVNIIDLSTLGPEFLLGLGASEVCVAPDGFGNEFTVHLIEDAFLPLDGDLNLTLKGGAPLLGASYDIKNNQSPCYVEMACEGVKALCISGNVSFPQSLLRKEKNGQLVPSEAVRAYFSSIYERDFSNATFGGDILPRTDFMLEFVMDDFQLTKLPGYSFVLKQGSLDLSETRNPQGMAFPEGYQADFAEENLWQGFFLRELEVMAPTKYTDGDERSRATIHNVLIDPALSMDVKAYHLLPFERGSFKGWGLGIDTFELSILQNTLIRGHLDGKFGSPVFQSDAHLTFKALLDEVNTGENDAYRFLARVEPSDDLQIPLAMAHATVCENSYLTARFSPDESEEQVELFMKGDLDINTGFAGISIGGNAHIRLADYQIQYNSVEGFVMREEISDGRGTYFGLDNNEEADCHDLGFISTEDVFDYLTQRMQEQGENIYRNYDEDEDGLSEPGMSNGEWRDGDEMNGLPIRFKKSGLSLFDGSPRLSLVVEAQLSPDNIIEAGMIIQSRMAVEGNRFHFGIENVELYLSQGSVVLQAPFNESSLATNEPIQVQWLAQFQDNALKERLQYQFSLLPLDSLEQMSSMDSLFRNSADFLYQQSDISGTDLTLELEEMQALLEVSKMYAFRVRATDPEGESLNNDGYSNIHLFTWGQSAIVGTNAGNNSACAERCSPELPGNTTAHSNPSSISSFTMGNFTVDIEGGVVSSGALINGQGVVTIDFLNEVRLGVTFTDVLLNEDGEALQGNVVGKSGNPGLLSQVGQYLAGASGSSTLSQLASFMDISRQVNAVMTSGEIDLPFGLQLAMQESDSPDNSPGNGLQVAFTGFRLTPTTAQTDFIFYLSSEALGDGFSFGVGAQNICIAPEGFGQEVRVYLAEDLLIPLDGATDITFHGGLSERQINGQSAAPFYLEIDCNGFKALHISGSATLPDNLLVKEDINTGEVISGESVKAYFNVLLEKTGGQAYTPAAQASSNTELLLGFYMDPFQVKGLKGWGFELTQGVLDLSENRNHPGMNFPENYDQADLPEPSFWTGFYLKELKLKPPMQYVDGEPNLANRPFLSIQNMLIDPDVTAVIQAQHLLSYEQGNIKGWGFSVDSFGLTVLQSQLISGNLSGRIGAPVMKEDDFLHYQATLDLNGQNDEEDLRFTAVVRPDGDIDLPLFAAQAQVCASSYLGFQTGDSEDDTHLELFLKGNASIDLGNLAESIPGEFTIAAADLQLKYNTVKGFVMQQEVNDGSGTGIGLGLAAGSVCAHEPSWPNFEELRQDYQEQGDAAIERNVAVQETQVSDDESAANPTESSMNGFPIRITDFGLGLEEGMPAVSFKVDLALADGSQGFAAGAGLTIKTKRTQNGGKFNIGFKSISFDCARLAADLDFIKLLGCLCHEQEVDDEGTRNGYFGKVVLQALDNVIVDLAGGFATYRQSGALEFGTDAYHAYWYVDGAFTTQAGIPIGPLRLNSLGGGIYWNMAPPALPNHDEIANAQADGAAQAAVDCVAELASTYNIQIPNGGSYLPSGPTYEYPKRAIKLNAGLSFTDPKLLILEPLVQVEWTAGQGIDAITVGGYLYMLQQDYMSRGAPASPPSNMQGEKPLAFPSKLASGGQGSRLWLSSFNTLYFDRESATKTLVAFRGTGNFYTNIIPNILYGNASANDPYRTLSHDIYIGHVDHSLSRSNGFQTAGDGQTYWHAYFGNPYTEMGPGSITFDLAAAVGGDKSSPPAGGSGGLTATAYAMMGHGLPNTLPPIPDLILEIINEGSEGDGENSFEGEPVDAKASREELQNTTSGFAFGSTVSLNIGFEKIIYANLEVVLGMDLLFQNTANTQCEANGNIYSPPGVANFYGMGQAFAGMRGALGVRGKVLGTEVDVKILELAAAMMVQAGGPNPFWVDGRAAVSYNILNGAIKGNARLEVSAGDRCYPYAADGFALDVIDAIYPDQSFNNDNPADPYAHPRVSFKMPVAHRDNPTLAAIHIPVVEKGKTSIKTLAPVLESFTLHRITGGGSSRTLTTVSGTHEFSETRRSLRYKLNSPMASSDQPDQANWRLELNIQIKAKERMSNGNWIYVDDFLIDSTVRFRAAPLPPYIEHVTHTNPIRGQRYYMPQEWMTAENIHTGEVVNNIRRGMIRTYLNESQQRFYPVDNKGNTCHYEIVIKRASDHEEVHRHTLQRSGANPEIDGRFLRFRLPATLLETNTRYYMQLVRRKEHPSGLPARSGNRIKSLSFTQIGSQVADQFDVEASYSIEYESEDENVFENVSEDETLLHLVVFGTSKFNNLAEKLEQMTIGYHGSANNSKQLRFTGLDEPFEQIELKGLTTQIQLPGVSETFLTPPRVVIFDPFEGNYYDEHVKPKVDLVLQNIRQKIDDVDVGLRYYFNTPGMDGGPIPLETGSSNWHGLGGPMPDFERHFLPPSNEHTHYLSFPRGGFQYLNSFAYTAGHNEIYGKEAVRLFSFINSQSFFNAPLPQASAAPIEIALGNFSFTGGTMSIGNKDVLLTYSTRQQVATDIVNLINWTESTIDYIRQPNSNQPIQTWSPTQLNNHLSSTISAHNALVNSELFYGSAAQLSPTGGQKVYKINFSIPFRPSSIRLLYNNDFVHVGHRWRGTLIEKEIELP